jgi:integrase
LIPRNVARLVELPEWHAGTIRPWTAEEARRFLAVSESDPLHAVFVLLVLYGLRRGEVLGLRWQDIDSQAGTIRIEQQVQRVGGEMHIGPVKTRAGHRNLP